MPVKTYYADSYGYPGHQVFVKTPKLKQPPTHARGPANYTLCGKGGIPGLSLYAVRSADKRFTRYCMTDNEERVTCPQCQKRLSK